MKAGVGLGSIYPDLRLLHVIEIYAYCERKLSTQLVNHLTHRLPFVVKLHKLLGGVDQSALIGQGCLESDGECKTMVTLHASLSRRLRFSFDSLHSLLHLVLFELSRRQFLLLTQWSHRSGCNALNSLALGLLSCALRLKFIHKVSTFLFYFTLLILLVS